MPSTLAIKRPPVARTQMCHEESGSEGEETEDNNQSGISMTIEHGREIFATSTFEMMQQGKNNGEGHPLTDQDLSELRKIYLKDRAKRYPQEGRILPCG